MPDTYAAQAYLVSQPFVDTQRIRLMGWCHGGWTTLYAIDFIYLTGLHVKPFRAAIAFYSWCIPTTAVGSLCRDVPGLLHTSPRPTGA
jgi:dienelactone hydrolase